MAAWLAVVVIPLFFRSHEAAARYFNEHRDEVDAVAGTTLQVSLPRVLAAREPAKITEGFLSQRFPSLSAADIPCLWVEGSDDEFFKVRLPSDLAQVSHLLGLLAASFQGAASFKAGQARFEQQVSHQVIASSPVKRVLVSLHGISTTGRWQKEMQASFDKPNVRIIHRPWDFGWFSIFELVIPQLRHRQVEWFLREYQDLLVEEGLDQDSPPSLIAHSFGTYIAAKALEKYPAIRFRSVIFCGSIVAAEFNWSERFERGQVGKVLNDYSPKDIWARHARWIVSDAGQAGYTGFSDASPLLHQRNNRLWNHSDYFHRLNFELNWIPFLLDKSIPTGSLQDRRARKANWRFRLVLVLLLAVIAWIAHRFGAL